MKTTPYTLPHIPFEMETVVVAAPDPPDPESHPRAFAGSGLGSRTVVRLREALKRSRHPMLIADDRRRWVHGNASACELLGLVAEEIPWCSLDDFTDPNERRRLDEQWRAFLIRGAAEGSYEMHVPGRGPVTVEFSATANVLPGRHLAVFVPYDKTSTKEAQPAAPRPAAWAAVEVEVGGRGQLTAREREVITLVAAGLRGGDMAERLLLSPETIKSHVRNAMGKLGARTRAHAVAIALVAGQITWEIPDR